MRPSGVSVFLSTHESTRARTCGSGTPDVGHGAHAADCHGQ